MLLNHAGYLYVFDLRYINRRTFMAFCFSITNMSKRTALILCFRSENMVFKKLGAAHRDCRIARFWCWGRSIDNLVMAFTLPDDSSAQKANCSGYQCGGMFFTTNYSIWLVSSCHSETRWLRTNRNNRGYIAIFHFPRSHISRVPWEIASFLSLAETFIDQLYFFNHVHLLIPLQLYSP